MQCEAILLGREQVDGAVDTSSLASLIRSLLPTTGRRPWSSSEHRYTLRCSDGLEFIKRSPHHKQSKRHDDEGFESDDDSASTRSLGSSADDTISNSSSCCFVDDHVFNARTTSAARVPSSSTSSCVSSVATDSANSSGASDTEDTSAPPTPTPTVVGTTSVSALVKSLSLFQQRNSTTELSKPPVNATAATAIRKDEHEDGKETYPVSEIAFCHTDSSFPRVVVWVVKKKRSQRLSPSGTDTSSGLEAVVFECSSEENTKKLCESFQETSRRAKLDQYRHPHRRKDTSPAPNRTQSSSITPESIIRALKDASEKTLTSTLKNTTVKPIIKPTHLPTSRTSSTNSTTSGPGSEVEVLSTVAGTRFNLVQRTDGDGVTHIEVSRGLPMENPVENLISLEEDQETCGPSSIIKIEGVIRSDVDIGLGPRKEAMQRQRQPAILVIHSGNGEDDSGELRKVWSPPATATPPQDTTDDLDDNSIDPPQRPERKKFVRRQKPPAPQPPSSNPHLIKSLIQSESSNKMSNLSKTQVDLNTSIVPHKKVTSNSNQQMVVRGQFIRVSVDQQQSQPAMVLPVIQQGGWMYGNNGNGSGNLIAYSPAPANWGMPLTTTLKSATNKNQTKNKTNPKKECEEMFTTSSAQQFQTQHYQKNRSRSRNNINANRRSKSPPARRPMAYRYIDTVPVSNNASTLSNRFFGLSQKLREIGGSVVNSNSNQPYIETARRRNSIGELPARFEYFGENCGGSCSEGKNGNLKSVIKKNRRLGEYTEPKKVTFSAYATVQVVD
ncbi:hypothetical protein L9F63_026234 [Diploptera punctata]|uniref:Uncharacterized protein n=1 Tax=Diploptera punctata TaxID=6984 RepID=A0AAD8ES04_DIPPU|nr:hypothetical protein L9F63_026234 [Diploptera punctata]